MSQALHSVSVAGVIVDDQGRALVIRRRDNGHWEPPGGVLEVDESIYDGLRREIAEETGLDIEVDGLTGVYKNMSRAIVALVFRCSTHEGALRLNPEVSEFRWMGSDEVRDNLDEAYAVRVLDGMAADCVEVRAHDGESLLPD
jgi:ADP-ribose pyrophosphatase YjhB (NUDIX family)